MLLFSFSLGTTSVQPVNYRHSVQSSITALGGCVAVSRVSRAREGLNTVDPTPTQLNHVVVR